MGEWRQQVSGPDDPYQVSLIFDDDGGIRVAVQADVLAGDPEVTRAVEERCRVLCEFITAGLHRAAAGSPGRPPWPADKPGG